MPVIAKKYWLVLATASSGMLLASLDFSVNVGLPDIATSFDADLTEIYKIITVYLGATATVQLILGRIADAYGLPGFRVKMRSEISGTVQEVKKINGPVLIEFVVEQHDMVYPMVPAGADLNEMINRPVHDQFQESEM